MNDTRYKLWTSLDHMGEVKVREELAKGAFDRDKAVLVSAWLAHRSALQAAAGRPATGEEAQAANLLAREAEELARNANYEATVARSFAAPAANQSNRALGRAKLNMAIALCALLLALAGLILALVR